MIRLIIYLTLFLFISSCSTNNHRWIETADSGVRIWTEQSDTTLRYSWDGETLDSVAHGQGTLTIFSGDTVIKKQTITARYGTINSEDLSELSESELYVGAIVNEKFDGYGVYHNGEDLYIGYFKNSKPSGFLNWYKSNKLYYTGYWKNGEFDGNGTLYKEDGTIRTGEWSEGKLTQTLVNINTVQGHYKGYIKNQCPDGIGSMSYSNGSQYSGAWKNGKWNGNGAYVNSTDTIVGSWENGKINGDVVYKTEDIFFEGTIVDNAPVGFGNLTVKNSSFYSGNWIDGKRCGPGDILFANGDSYSGEWDNNTFNGVGKYIYGDGVSSYEGSWKDGLKDGYGYYRTPEFAYRGEWEKGWMDGDGVFVFKNGDRYEGSVHENKIEGSGTYRYANGNVYEGEFTDGKIDGLGRFTFKDGTQFQGEFTEGKIYGDGTLDIIENGKHTLITGFWPKDGNFPDKVSMLFSNGDLYEGPFKNGCPTEEGIWTSGKEREAKLANYENSSIHRANEFYKEHRETIDACLIAASITLTAIEMTPIPHVAVGAKIANHVVNVADASLAIASAAIDLQEASELGEDTHDAGLALAAEVSINAVCIALPEMASSKKLKPLGTGVKKVVRSPLTKLGMRAVKKSALKFAKGKLMNKAFKIVVNYKGGVRKVEKVLYRSKATQKATIATERLFTRQKHQFINYNAYQKAIQSNPELKKGLSMSTNGSSANLGANMRSCCEKINKWVNKNERIKRYLSLPKRQIEPHHIIPSNPTTEAGRQAKQIWTKSFGSVDHPCNGIWLGRRTKGGKYFSLAKGSNHGPNTIEYEQKVSNAIISTYKKYSKKYANNPEMMRKVLAETVDGLKKQIYKGDLLVGKTKEVHSVLSIFKQQTGVASSMYKQIASPITKLMIE